MIWGPCTPVNLLLPLLSSRADLETSCCFPLVDSTTSSFSSLISFSSSSSEEKDDDDIDEKDEEDEEDEERV